MKATTLDISAQSDTCLSISEQTDHSPEWRDARHCDRSLHLGFPFLMGIFIKISRERVVITNSMASLGVSC